MATIANLIAAKKSGSIISVSPGDTVYDALKLMAEKSIGALLVMEQGEVKGILSERDYARKVILHNKSSRDTKVSEIMTAPVISIPPETSPDAALAVMTAKHIRHLPVMKGNELQGIISIGDVVKFLLEEKDVEISNLSAYISGAPSLV